MRHKLLVNLILFVSISITVGLIKFYFPDAQKKLQEATGQKEIRILDARYFGYNSEEVSQLFGQLGRQGITLYRETVNFWDMIFPVAYTASMMILLFKLLKSLECWKKLWKALPLLPFIGMMADFIENKNTLLMLDIYENSKDVYLENVIWGSFFSQLKWVTILSSVIIILVLFSIWASKSIRRIIK